MTDMKERECQSGDEIKFGGYNRRVLDVRDGKALIITENVIELCPFNVQYIDGLLSHL